jgi:hypothetical protein
MSLLTTASLVITPNAGEEGTLFSIVPDTGLGDMSVVRATTATRVNSDGLVELVPYNLLQRSEEFENASWTKSNVTIIPNDVTAPNGTLTADKLYPTSSGNYRHVKQSAFSPYTGLKTMSIYAKKAELSNITLLDYDSGGAGINFNLNTGVATDYATTPFVSYSMTDVGDGWYRCTATALNGNFYWIVTSGGNSVAVTANGTDGIYIWGAQLVEGTNALPYQKTETRLNIPRLDYSLGGCPNILLEPQRTNLTTYSEQFDDASWNKINSSVTANADISPDGYTNADRIYDNATSGQHRVGKNISVVSATTYTFSVFAKKGSLRYCYLFTVAGGASDRYYFDLQDGVSITAGGKIEDYGSGWYRISAQVTAAATGNELFAFNLTNSSSSPTYSGTGTGYHMIYGYQVEAGDYATSYIPTTTASVTRNKDTTVEKDLTSFGIGNSYTLLFDLTMATEDSNKILFYLKNSAGADSFTFRNFSGILSVYDAIGLTYPLAALANESTKWAFRFDGVNYSLFRVSGGVAVKNTATLGTARNIGYLNSFNISGTKASLKLLAIEPSALTDVECEQFVIS